MSALTARNDLRHLNSTLSCRLCMHCITLELLLGVACTAVTPGTQTHACSVCMYRVYMRPLIRKAPRKEWWVPSQTPHAKIVGLESACRHSHAGAYGSCRTVGMVLPCTLARHKCPKVGC